MVHNYRTLPRATKDPDSGWEGALMILYQAKAKQKPVKLKTLLSCIILNKTYPTRQASVSQVAGP